MIAYHFISEKYALDVISNQCIKLSLFHDLNDPFELLSVDLPNEQSRNEARKFKDFMAEQCGILCFSRNWKNPLLWSHYANRHKGVAFQFKLRNDIALPVKYRKSRFEIDFAKKILLKENITKEETEGIWLTKFESWKYEEELRVVCSKKDCTNINGFLFHPLNDEISLKGIVLGPLCKITVDDIRSALPNNKEIEIIKARLAFRSFDIVQQRTFKKIRIKK